MKRNMVFSLLELEIARQHGIEIKRFHKDIDYAIKIIKLWNENGI